MSKFTDKLAQITEEVDEVELRQPDVITVLKIIWYSIDDFFRERPGQIIGSAFILLMVWGFHGNLELLGEIWPEWKGPGVTPYEGGTRPSAFSDIVPWDLEIISFWVGAFLVVVVPMLLIKFGFKQSLSAYGLGMPRAGRRRLATIGFLTLTLLSAGAFYFGAQSEAMQALYPYYRPFSSFGQFALYQVMILPFYIAIEFIFRGYLLFGLGGVRDDEIERTSGGVKGVFYFHRYALLIQMLAYTAWHLGKPLPELWGTLVWGLAAGAVAYAVRSIWPVVLSHWLLNVFIDYLILQNTNVGSWP